MATRTASKTASKRAAAAPEIPKTTAPVVDADVTKVAIVQPGASQPIDQKATAEAIEADRIATEARDFANSPAGRLAASPLMFIDDPLARKRYVGVPPGEGEVSIHGTPGVVLIKTPLGTRAPERGLMVYPEKGEPFSVPEGVDNWLAVMDGEGNPLIAAVSKAEAKKEAAKSSR